jgi:tetratricopeptide (TPR) repeat protein
MSSRRFPSYFTLTLLFCSASAQTFHFSDGRKASFPEAKIRGTNIVLPLKVKGAEESGAELTLPISSLSRVDWPAPAALVEAEAALNANQPAVAVNKVDAVLAEQEIFLAIPGSWWSQGAAIKAVALARLGKEVDAEVLLERLRRVKAPAESLSRVELALIDQLLASGKTEAASTRLEKFAQTATDDAALAYMAIIKGRILGRAGKTEEALLSFLRVPVFYANEQDKIPAALYGAAQAYKQLGDEARALSTHAEIKARFPNSPEANQDQR